MNRSPSVNVQNVVALTQLDCELRLKAVSIDLSNAEYDHENDVIHYESPNSGTTLLIYSTGKVLSTGGSSTEEAEQSLRDLHNKLQQMGVPVTDDLTISIENIVGTTTVEEQLSLEPLSLALGLENVEYDPSEFPALFYRPQYSDVAFLIFSNGKINVMGAGSIEESQNAVGRLLDELDGIEADPTNVEPQTSQMEALIEQYSTSLGIDDDVQGYAHDILNRSARQGIGVGRSDNVRAAGAVYLASEAKGEQVTQKELGDVAGCSVVSIRNIYQEYENAIAELSQTEEELSQTEEENPVAGQSQLSKTDVLTLLRYTAVKAERAPKVSDINYHTEFGLDDVKTHFESLSAAREAAGVSKDTTSTEPLWEQEDPEIEASPPDMSDKRRGRAVTLTHPYSEEMVNDPDRETLLDEIKRLAPDASRPTREDVESRSPFGIEQYESVFGTWADALECAGYEINRGRSEAITRDSVIDCLQSVARQTGGRPRVADVNNHGSISAQSVYKYFDDWDEALHAAGVADGPSN